MGIKIFAIRGGASEDELVQAGILGVSEEDVRARGHPFILARETRFSNWDMRDCGFLETTLGYATRL